MRRGAGLRRRSAAIGLLVVVSATGCAAKRAYRGDPRPETEVAILSAERGRIVEVDGSSIFSAK